MKNTLPIMILIKEITIKTPITVPTTVPMQRKIPCKDLIYTGSNLKYL